MTISLGHVKRKRTYLLFWGERSALNADPKWQMSLVDNNTGLGYRSAVSGERLRVSGVSRSTDRVCEQEITFPNGKFPLTGLRVGGVFG